MKSGGTFTVSENRNPAKAPFRSLLMPNGANCHLLEVTGDLQTVKVRF